MIDILQPCVTFNKVNTFAWYKKRAYKPQGHDPSDFNSALDLARQWGDKIPIGILYSVPRPTFESNFPLLQGDPLCTRPFNPSSLSHLQDEFL